MSAVAFGVGLANGLTILILGGAFIFGELWIERSGDRRPTFAIVWRVSLRIALGATIVVLAIASSGGWGTALLILFATWLVVPALLVATVGWRERREQVMDRDK